MNELHKHYKKDVALLLDLNRYARIYDRLRLVLSDEELKLFANPKMGETRCSWSAIEGGAWKSFSDATEEQKDEAATVLQEIKEQILHKIQEDKQLREVEKNLFKIPSEGSVYLKENEDGSTAVTITQWACLAAVPVRGHDPLAVLFNRPKKNHSLVQVRVTYSDGSLYSSEPLFAHYKGRILPKKTNEEGIVSLGLVKNDTEFTLSPTSALLPEPQYHVVAPEAGIYELEFPYFLSFNIRVTNQKGEPVSNTALSADYTGQLNFITDTEGMVQGVKVILENTPFVLSESDNPENTQTYHLEKTTEVIEFKVETEELFPVRIKVVEGDDPVPGHPIQVSIDGKEAHSYQSDTEGYVGLGKVVKGKAIQVVDGEDKTNSKVYEVEEEVEEYIFPIERIEEEEIEPEFIRVRLLDSKSNPIPDATLNLSLGTSVESAITDETGTCSFPKDLFSPDNKVPVKVELKNKKGKTKKYNKKFTYKEDQEEYVLKLKSYRWLWWLLLLLLPLVLLIKYDKEISVQTLDKATSNVVPKVDVKLSYVYYALYDKGRFFVADTLAFTEKTDSSGYATFTPLKTTVYSLLLKMNKRAHASAITECYLSEPQSPKFHFTKKSDPIKLCLVPTQIPLDFLVLDAEDSQPIPQANVFILAQINTNTFPDSAHTSADGKVLFEKNPKCGSLVKAIAQSKGYYSDTLMNLSIDSIAGGESEPNRVFRLKPIKTSITFYVNNCKTGEPLPNAKAKVMIAGVDPSAIKTIPTNINGVGKGFCDDLHVIKNLTIEVSKKYFKSATWDKGKTVEEFTQLTKQDRTICLEPKDLTLDFENVDARTKKPLKGVKNVISISGGTNRVDTIISNSNGKFTVAGIQSGDKISISANLDPQCHPNNTKVKNADVVKLKDGPASGRVIPLNPKEIPLKFRTINPETDTLIADVTLTITVDGNNVAPRNSGNGSFSVKGFYDSKISIVAEKAGYKTNDDKIRNDAFKVLEKSVQAERDIPMVLPPCGIETRGNTGKDYYIDKFNMGQRSGFFNFEYYTDTKADEIIVYCGDGVNGKRLFYYNAPTGSDTFTERINFNCSVITVEVRGSSEWNYKVNCP